MNLDKIRARHALWNGWTRRSTGPDFHADIGELLDHITEQRKWAAMWKHAAHFYRRADRDMGEKYFSLCGENDFQMHENECLHSEIVSNREDIHQLRATADRRDAAIIELQGIASAATKAATHYERVAEDLQGVIDRLRAGREADEQAHREPTKEAPMSDRKICPVSFAEAARRYCEAREAVNACRDRFKDCTQICTKEHDYRLDPCWKWGVYSYEDSHSGELIQRRDKWCPECLENEKLAPEMRRLKRRVSGFASAVLKAYRREFTCARNPSGEPYPDPAREGE